MYPNIFCPLSCQYISIKVIQGPCPSSCKLILISIYLQDWEQNIFRFILMYYNIKVISKMVNVFSNKTMKHILIHLKSVKVWAISFLKEIKRNFTEGSWVLMALIRFGARLGEDWTGLNKSSRPLPDIKWLFSTVPFQMI